MISDPVIVSGGGFALDSYLLCLLTCSRESEHQRMRQPHAGFRQLEIRHHDAGERPAAP